ILPLGFGRQVVVPTLLPLAELVQKGERVVPRNTFHWLVRMAPELAWIVAHHRFPLRLRDRVLPQIKRLADGDTVGWPFEPCRFCIYIRIWQPHHEHPCLSGRRG